MVGRDSFFYGDPEDNGFHSSSESDSKQNHYNGTYRSSTMGQPYPYPFPKPEIYTPIDKSIPLEPRKKGNTKIQTHYHRERERALSQLSVGALIERLIHEENRTQEAKALLKTAISHLEVATERADRAEKARKMLEEERRTMETNQTIHGLKVTQGIMNAQKETAKAQEEAGLYKLQLRHAEREVQRAHSVVKTIEDERENALYAAKKAKEFARKMNEEKLMLVAREEGRKEGFEEGMRQGRLLALTGDETNARHHILDRTHATPVGSGAAFIEEYNGDEDGDSTDPVQEDGHTPHNGFNRPDMTRSMHSRPRQRRTPHLRHASLDSTPRGRSNVSRSVPTHSQPQTPQVPASTVPASNASAADDTLRQELETARQEKEASDALRREAEQREEIRQWHERQDKGKREREQQALLEREKARQAELDREREALRAKDAERDREMEAIRQRDRDREAERARELEELKKEREAREREREQDRVREREREREEARQKELSAATQSAAATRPTMNLPYLPMPPPPASAAPPPNQAPVIPPPPLGRPQSRTQPQQFQPSHRRRRSSPDTRSPSSSTTGISQLDIVTFPTSGVSRREDRDRDRDLSDIPEVPSIRSQSRASEAQPTPPSWISNPPVDYTMRGNIDNWRHSTSTRSPPDTTSALSPLENDYLSPSFQPRGRGTERIPSSDYRRTSSGSSNSYNFVVQPPSRPASRPQEPDVERHGFLSPNHTPRTLVSEPPAVIAPTEIFVVPPPGFVAYSSPRNGHANLGGNGGNPPNTNIYSPWSAPGSPGAQAAPLSAHGPSSAGTRYTETPPSHYPYNPHLPPRPIYAPTPPAHSQPLRGSERPVIPPPFSQMASRQPSGGYSTPGPYHRSLSGGPPATAPPSGPYSRPTSNSYDDIYEGSDSPPDPATQRNTMANAASAVGALPIPPPSFSRQRY